MRTNINSDWLSATSLLFGEREGKIPAEGITEPSLVEACSFPLTFFS